jgi:hypothetical protein
MPHYMSPPTPQCPHTLDWIYNVYARSRADIGDAVIVVSNLRDIGCKIRKGLGFKISSVHNLPTDVYKSGTEGRHRVKSTSDLNSRGQGPTQALEAVRISVQYPCLRCVNITTLSWQRRAGETSCIVPGITPQPPKR